MSEPRSRLGGKYEHEWAAPDTEMPRATTTVVRIPDELAEEIRRWAKILGKSQGALLREAWEYWLRTHKDEILADLDRLRAKIEAI